LGVGLGANNPSPYKNKFVTKFSKEPRTWIIWINDLSNEGEEDEMGGACSTNGEKRNAYRLLVGKPEGRRLLGRPRRRWLDNIRMDLGEVGWGDVDCIGLAQDRDRWRALVNSVLNLRVP
jgi:hypothetical protein